jgi:hypothetical protein
VFYPLWKHNIHAHPRICTGWILTILIFLGGLLTKNTSNQADRGVEQVWRAGLALDDFIVNQLLLDFLAFGVKRELLPV